MHAYACLCLWQSNVHQLALFIDSDIFLYKLIWIFLSCLLFLQTGIAVASREQFGLFPAFSWFVFFLFDFRFVIDLHTLCIYKISILWVLIMEGQIWVYKNLTLTFICSKITDSLRIKKYIDVNLKKVHICTSACHVCFRYCLATT